MARGRASFSSLREYRGACPAEPLFGEVHDNFSKNGYLTAEEFFAIAIWKAPRNKTRLRKGIERTGGGVISITKRLLSKDKFEKELIAGLKKIKGIGLPMASAILSVCYPDRFTIVDVRAVPSLMNYLGAKTDKENFKEERKRIFKADPSNSIRAYLEYCDICLREAEVSGLSLRDFDRYLFGRDVYGGKLGIKDLAIGL